jgi:hypothetical protein
MSERVRELEDQFRMMNEYHRQMFEDKSLQEKMMVAI